MLNMKAKCPKDGHPGARVEAGISKVDARRTVIPAARVEAGMGEADARRAAI